MSTTIDDLKSRALATLGVVGYRAGSQTPPCVAVDALYLPTLREFMAERQWTWAVVRSEDAPVSPLVLHQVNPFVYVPDDFNSIPAEQPLAQQAFVMLLATRCAVPAASRADMVPMLSQQYAKALSNATYPNAWELCRQGRGALTSETEVL